MGSDAFPASGRPAASSRRSLTPLLLGVALLQACFLGGLYAGSGTGARAAAGSTASAPIIRWRRSQYDRARDPSIRRAAPAVRLLSETGLPLDGADLRGKRVVLIFARDDAG